ncbi:hypothetical protein containing chitin-binding domain type 3 [Acidovorax sp. CF316]|nr:hypothetical protein containing chitin-binding domain type 3 [Acidovorax sp. CF316]
MKNAVKHRTSARTPVVPAAWRGRLALGALASAFSLLAGAAPVGNASTCFHQNEGLQLRFDLDLAQDSVDAGYDVYLVAAYAGHWFYRNAAGGWAAHQPGTWPAPALRNVAHPQKSATAPGNALHQSIAEPAVRSAAGLAGLQLFAGFGKSGPGSFEDLLARQRFGAVGAIAGNEAVVAACPATPPGTGPGGTRPGVPDATPPSAPTDLRVVQATSTSLRLQWQASTDNVAVAAYAVYLDGVLQDKVSTTTHTLTGLAPATSYALRVHALDAAGNASAASGVVQGRTQAATSPAHGRPYSIIGSSLGSKADHNAGGYTFFGQRHLLARFTDFGSATGQAPAANTKAAWRTHLDGIYPILTSTDFNAQATESGATLELSGGTTPSGRWLKRSITQATRDRYPSSYRLRNWNLWDTNAYYPQMYYTGYINLSTIDAPGKYLRFYWTDSSNPNRNVWTAKEGGSLTARAEGANTGVPGIYSDAPVRYTDNTWMRYEILADFANDKVAFYANGKLLTDVSRNYTGENTGWLGVGGKLDYFLLNNTVEMNGDLGEFIGHAMPYLDFSLRRIELADAPQWEQRTDAVVQVPTRWDNGQVDIVINQGRFPDLNHKHLFLLNGMQATYLGPLQ